MRRALVRVEIVAEDVKLARAILDSITPETRSSPSKNARAKVSLENGKVFLTIEAYTTAALRALFNSYMSWISSVINTIAEVESIGRKDPS